MNQISKLQSVVPAGDIVSALVHGNRDRLISAREVYSACSWRQACIDLITDAPATVNQDSAHACFTEFGHRVREKLEDDRLLVSALRQLLPTFVGVGAGQGLVLYRGENLDRYHDGRVGLCWSPTRTVAEMFGRGLNAMAGQGGCLLQAYAPSHAIIAGPNSHSRWLGEEEYLVDPRLAENIELVVRYPNLWE